VLLLVTVPICHRYRQSALDRFCGSDTAVITSPTTGSVTLRVTAFRVYLLFTGLVMALATTPP